MDPSVQPRNRPTPAGPAMAPETAQAGRTTFTLSSCVILLAGAASTVGLVVDDVYAGPVSVAEMLRGFDLVTLIVVVPALIVAQWGTRRGSERAQLMSAGLLAYVVYTYAYHLFGTGFNDVFLLHIAVFGASVFALVFSVSGLDMRALADATLRRVPRRLVSGVLGLLAASLGGMWIYSCVRFALTGDVPVGSALVEPDGIVHLGIALDLALLVPAYAVAAVQLWRGAVAGFVLASVMLLSGTLHQLDYLVALLFQAAAGVPGAVAFDPVEPAIALLYVVATVLLLRPTGWDRRPADEKLAQRRGHGVHRGEPGG
jgi:hypothetical protein